LAFYSTFLIFFKQILDFVIYDQSNEILYDLLNISIFSHGTMIKNSNIIYYVIYYIEYVIDIMI